MAEWQFITMERGGSTSLGLVDTASRRAGCTGRGLYQPRKGQPVSIQQRERKRRRRFTVEEDHGSYPEHKRKRKELIIIISQWSLSRWKRTVSR